MLAFASIMMGVITIDVNAQDESELAKQSQNPVSDLISVPFQNNFNFGAGSKDKMIYLLNIQPVIPFHLSEDWNLITRVIMPVINQPSLFPGLRGATGLGDINRRFFYRQKNWPTLSGVPGLLLRCRRQATGCWEAVSGVCNPPAYF
jgi:hypothetical protein